MGTPKLRIVFYEDNEKALSYFHLEITESLRVLEILKILPNLKEWTPISAISKMINSKTPSTLWAVQKLAGALRIDIKLKGEYKIISKRPILLIRKEQYNQRNNLKKYKYLRPTVCIKGHFR